MARYTEELFETIILQPTGYDGQRSALAFFAAGTQGIITARRAAKNLKAKDVVTSPTYLGGPQVEIESDLDRKASSSEGWNVESAVGSATHRWFFDHHADFSITLNGAPRDRLAKSVIFVSDKNYVTRGSVRRIDDWACLFSGSTIRLIAFNGSADEQDWLAREMVSSVGGALLWPTARFKYGKEPLGAQDRQDYDEMDQHSLAFFLEMELGRIVTGIAA